MESLLNSVTKTEAAYQNLRWNILIALWRRARHEPRDTGAGAGCLSHARPGSVAAPRERGFGAVCRGFDGQRGAAQPSGTGRALPGPLCARPAAARLTAAVASDEELHAIGATLHAETGDVSDERLFEHNRGFTEPCTPVAATQNLWPFWTTFGTAPSATATSSSRHACR